MRLVLKKASKRSKLPGSTAWTRTGESEQMVKPKPSFPLKIVTCVRQGKECIYKIKQPNIFKFGLKQHNQQNVFLVYNFPRKSINRKRK